MSFLSSFLCGLTLTLAPEARVQGTEIELHEIGAFSGDDGDLAARLRALPLGYAPAPGYARLVARAEIERAIESAVPGAAIEIRGAACRAVAEVERVGGADLARAAEAALSELFAGRDAAMRALAEPAALDVPRSSRPPELRASLARQAPRPGRWSVPIEVWVEGGLYQTVWTSYQVDLVEEQPVLVRDVRRGEYLDAGAVEMRRVRLSGELSGAPLPAHLCTGSVAVRPLTAGSVLCDRDVERVHLVRRGDAVQLVVRKGPITARSSAVARTDGFLGDRIRVGAADRVLDASAVVVGRGVVEIDLASPPRRDLP
jgi:flagella basal body P-ring formation protein FlgA